MSSQTRYRILGVVLTVVIIATVSVALLAITSDDNGTTPATATTPGGAELLVLLVLIVIVLAVVAFWLWPLVDAVSRPESQWQRADQSKIVWVMLIIFLGLLGSVLYLAIARPALTRAAVTA